MEIFYTYLIGWTSLQQYYYGVRYGKGSNPNELWKTYFTSSKIVDQYRIEHGEPDIIQVRKTFDNAEKARLFEHKILKRLNVTRSTKWLNQTDNICFSPSLMAEIGKTKTGKLNNFYGRKHSEETKEKIRKKQLERMSDPNKRQLISEKTKNGMKKYKEKMTSDDWQKRYEIIANQNRVRNKGQIPWNKGKTLTEDHKRKISETEKRTKAKNETRYCE